ncbi:hypothetical protein [Pedobacter agri]|uniref:hypothetical protein n=1 Tax=Pedobacter agri TaxID=454586 RepID=UPI002930DBC6|nr:hypothetical protein [Pedobacter agri]
MSEIIKISEIEEAIRFHEQKALELKSALYILRNFEANFKSHNPLDLEGAKTKVYKVKRVETIKRFQPSIFGETAHHNKTFKETVIEMLADEKTPFTGRQIFNHFNTVTGRDLEYNSFSAQLSNVVSSQAIKKHTFADNSMESKFYYGLSHWFEDGKLKKEYIDKIEKPEINQAQSSK